jgi:hypothetical protein
MAAAKFLLFDRATCTYRAEHHDLAFPTVPMNKFGISRHVSLEWFRSRLGGERNAPPAVEQISRQFRKRIAANAGENVNKYCQDPSGRGISRMRGLFPFLSHSREHVKCQGKREHNIFSHEHEKGCKP